MVYLSKQKESNLHHYKLFHSADWIFFNRVALLTNRYPFPKMLVSGYFNNVISWLSSRASIATTPTPLVGVLPLHHTSINLGLSIGGIAPGPPPTLVGYATGLEPATTRTTIWGTTIVLRTPYIIHRTSLLSSGDPHTGVKRRGFEPLLLDFGELCSRVGSNHRPSPRHGDILPLNYRNIGFSSPGWI